ncbi:Lin1244/Lin1753 domain-containing protein [Halobacillus litoralis]|uniref:Lin1244/Lin1753 domain-containing protein n=1 Tax=Halobacillus litoralis TaxID=45668 RepID=UPI001CD7560E|nr:Lin1244/Lin1753 domain-containing protein [Halobacillus litoralis]MCA1021818.1 DUF4373 domain-containing protein [Halobacillus litoralis]
MSKEAYYFSHDSNARNDPKIMAMISEHGIQGYGMFWVVVEMLREQEEYKLPVKKYVFNALAMQTQCGADAMQSFVDACINEYELFESDGEFFWSNSLKKRMNKKNTKSEKAKKAAEARWNKARQNKDSDKQKENEKAQAMQPHSKRNAQAMPKGKESKEKESKSINTAEEERASSENPYTVYEDNYGIIKPILKDTIDSWCDDLSDDIVIAAMKLGYKKGGRTFGYVEEILKEWTDQQLKSLDEVRTYENHKRDKKKTVPFKKASGDNNVQSIFDKYRNEEGEG